VSVLKEKKMWKFVNTIVLVPFLDPIVVDVHEVKEGRD
jgi:hypothetical protein